MDITKETLWAIGTVGIVTNLLNIKVCHSEPFLKTTMGFFNIRISIFNILTILFVGFLSTFPQSLVGKTDASLVLTANAVCKTLPYLSQIFTQMSSWLMVMASYDRLYTLSLYNSGSYNPSVEEPCSTIEKMKLSRATKCLFFLIGLINIPNLIFYLDTTAQRQNRSFICTADPTVTKIRDIVEMMSFGVVPFVLQMIINIKLTGQIRKHNERILNDFLFARKRKNSYTFAVFNFILITCNLFCSASRLLSTYFGGESLTVFYVLSLFISLFWLCDCLFIVNMITFERFRQEAQRIFLY
jgi:hypothetical protein